MNTYILIVLAITAFKLGWDWYAKNKQKRVIDHKRSAMIDTALFTISSLYLFGFTIKAIGWLFIAWAIRWFVFDLLFNLLNKDEWNHCGDTAWLDIKVDLIDKKDDNICKYGFALKGALALIGIILILI